MSIPFRAIPRPIRIGQVTSRVKIPSAAATWAPTTNLNSRTVTTRSGEHRDQEVTTDPGCGNAQRHEHGNQCHVDEEQHSQQDAPAHRSEEPVCEEEHPANRQQQRQDEQRSERDAGEQRHATDLGADLAGLGPGKIDVRVDQAHRGITDGRDLLEQPLRLALRSPVPGPEPGAAPEAAAPLEPGAAASVFGS